MARNQYFYDVNTRMGRFMMNGILLNAGFLVINVPTKRQLEFNTLMLAFYDSNQPEPMNAFLRSCLDPRKKRNVSPREITMINFWQVHGLIFAIALFFFPRLTMLLSGICFAWSSLLFWLGWVFAPRLTVAILATTVYWHTNTILCVITWIWALGGEIFEKQGGVYIINRRKVQ